MGIDTIEQIMSNMFIQTVMAQTLAELNEHFSKKDVMTKEEFMRIQLDNYKEAKEAILNE